MNRSRDESSSSSVSVASSNGGKAKRSKNIPNTKNSNPNTVEKVRKIMEQEGRSARNLVSWSIPLDSYGSSKGKSGKSKSMNLSRKSLHMQEELESSGATSVESSGKKSTNTPNRRSTSGVRKHFNIRARYWAYLFENLRRAVDEIYATCEDDASVVECKEVLMILDNYHHDFQALIDWLNLQERLEKTDIQDRPTSLAWEVRKSSPGRPRQKIISRGVGSGSGRTATGNISRCLNFSSPSDAAALVTASAVYRSLTGLSAPSPTPSTTGSSKPQSEIAQKTTTTWADRVKGVKPQPVGQKTIVTKNQRDRSKNKSQPVSIASSLEQKHIDDGGGWETVTSKNRQLKLAKSLKQADNRLSEGVAKNSAGHADNKLQTPHPNPKSPPARIPASVSSSSSISSGGGFVNIVMDRIIGMEGMRNHDSKAPSAPQDRFKADDHVKKKVQFCSDIVKNDYDDDDDDDDDDSKDDDSNDIYDDSDITATSETVLSSSIIEEDNLILKKLEEEEALLARTLHAEHDASIAVAEQRERELLLQIKEAKELETPELDTDCDSARSSAGAKELPLLENPPQQPLEWADFVARFEAEQATVAGLSWNDLVEEEELREPGRAVQMHEKLSSPSRKRTPAESRRKQEEKHRRAEERRQQMHQERTQKIHELTEKVQEVVSWKNDLIKRQRNLLQSFHSEKLARAEEQRAMQLLSIKKKARVEDTKVNEIAFINELQEQNKRHEVLMRIEEHESRIQELGVERGKMQEMKSFKEESVKERRRALEKERQDRIEELKTKRQEQIARVEQQKIEKEKEREKLAKERARDREMRLSALNAAKQEAVTELQKKIQMKHDESERRHQVQLEQRKEKAVELSLGRFSLNSSLIAPFNVTQSSAVASPTIQTSSSSKITSGFIIGSSESAPGVTGFNEVAADEKQSGSDNSSLNSPRNLGCGDEDLKRKAEEEERMKVMKSRLKKLRSRITSRGEEFSKRFEEKANSKSANKSRVLRFIKDIKKLLTNRKGSSGPWPTNQVATLDRCLGEMNRIMEKQPATSEQTAFRVGGGFALLDQLFSSFLKEVQAKDVHILPNRSLGNAAVTFRNACRGCLDNCAYVLFAGRMTSLIDLTSSLVSMNSPGQSSVSRGGSSTKKKEIDPVFDSSSPSLLSSLSVVISELRNVPSNNNFNNLLDGAIAKTSSKNFLESYFTRGSDIVSYSVASGIVDSLSCYFKGIRHEVEPGSSMSRFVANALAFLESLTSFISMRNQLLSRSSAKSSKKQKEAIISPSNFDRDPTLLLSTLQQTDLMGIVSVLYGLLLHGAPERPTTLRSASAADNLAALTSSESKSVPEHTLSVAIAVLSVLNAVGEMDLPLLQASLAAEGISLAFRHICTYLLWYCVERDHADLLQEAIVCVGHFTLGNKGNQDLVDSGAQPTVLQQLCTLPFAFFSSPPLMHVLLPTLIACCHDNKSNVSVLEQEASSSMLVDFIETFLKDESARGDKKAKPDNKKDPLPHSLADNYDFDSRFLHRALDFFKNCHVSDDMMVNCDKAIGSS